MFASRSTEARMSSISMVARLGCVLWGWGEAIAVTMATGFGSGGWIESGAEIMGGIDMCLRQHVV